MNRESFNLNTNQNPEEVIKDLNDLRGFDLKQLETLKEEDPEAYYRLMERVGEEEVKKYQNIPPDDSPLERIKQEVNKKSSKSKKDEDSVYRKKHVDYSQWLREH